MDFKQLSLGQLDSKHPEYDQKSPVWRTIDTLRQGFPAIKTDIEKYLPKRPVEDDELYKLRTAKLAYSPVMSHIVHTYTGKMAMAGIDFPEKAKEVWGSIRKDNTPKGDTKRDEMSLVCEIFTDLLYFGISYVMVDVPKEATIARSSFELRQSGLMPFFSRISPLEVINWGDDWVIRKQYISESTPFEVPSTYALYSYIGKEQIVTFKIKVQLGTKEDSEQNSYPVVTKVWYNNDWEVPDDDIHKYDPFEILEGVGLDRLVKTDVSADKWLCLALFNKQIQHLRIENAWTDAGYLSGTVQRVFTPQDPVVADDPRVSYSTSDIEKQLAKAGNAHILVGKGYAFVESSGAALGNLEQMLDKIEEQISKIANMHFATGKAGTLQQSGLSKKLDMSLLEGTMQEYGTLLVDSYNSLLAIVAGLLSIPTVTVGGLSDFTEADPSVTLAAIGAIAPLTDYPLLGKALVYRKLLNDLEITVAPEEDTIITAQLAAIDYPQPPKPVSNSL